MLTTIFFLLITKVCVYFVHTNLNGPCHQLGYHKSGLRSSMVPTNALILPKKLSQQLPIPYLKSQLPHINFKSLKFSSVFYLNFIIWCRQGESGDCRFLPSTLPAKIYLRFQALHILDIFFQGFYFFYPSSPFSRGEQVKTWLSATVSLASWLSVTINLDYSSSMEFKYNKKILISIGREKPSTAQTHIRTIA